MQLSGLLYGASLLKHVGFPTAEVLGPAASEGETQDLISCAASARSLTPAMRSAYRTASSASAAQSQKS